MNTHDPSQDSSEHDGESAGHQRESAQHQRKRSEHQGVSTEHQGVNTEHQRNSPAHTQQNPAPAAQQGLTPATQLPDPPAKRLAGKVAIVTGAGCVGPGWGNGRAIAFRFAQEGAKVFAVDRSLASMDETQAKIHAIDGDISPYECDITNTDAVIAMVQACKEKYGAVDILVNNVGGPLPGGAEALSENDWDQQIDLNLKTVFIVSKQVIPVMAAQGGGCIVNIASTSGIRWTGAPQIGYAAAKAGVIQYGRVAAVELAKKGIRVNAVVPGQLYTPLVDKVLARTQSGNDTAQLLERRQKRIPLPFMGDGLDTANAALFLASDEARFITGTELVVDGGMSARCD
ncbi:SDR family oxidoreductase [Alcaligenaceae bacterium]|nr:SDR family oxidoreductase [Alcaligenaceae bacterium]